MDKPAHRRRARALAPASAVESAAVVAHLRSLPELARARRACLFLPMPGELDLRALPGHLPDLRWTTTRTGPDRLLTVHGLDAPRERHPFGYDQPVPTAPRVEPATVDLWLVPGLAFDLEGTRLGHGAGYYDRLLARRRADATTVAVTVRRRLVPSLPREDHDVPMDVVVTEEGVHRPGTPTGPVAGPAPAR